MNIIQFNRFSKITILVAASLILTQCSRNPVTGKKELSLMSESQEIALGQQSDPSVQAEFGIYPDGNVTSNYMDQIFYYLLLFVISHLSPLLRTLMLESLGIYFGSYDDCKGSP